MKKLISVMLVILLLSGCSLLLPQISESETQLFKTNNGSLIVFNKDEKTLFCSKTEVDEMLNQYEQNSIKDEFSIDNYDSLSYQEAKDKYKIMVSKDNTCQYNNYYLDFTSKENYIVLDEIKIDDPDKINDKTLDTNGIIKDFLKEKPQTVNEVLFSFLLKEVGMGAIVKKDFDVDSKGTYQLVAQPLFRMYYLKDIKKVYDYSFSTIIGFSLKLVKQ